MIFNSILLLFTFMFFMKYQLSISSQKMPANITTNNISTARKKSIIKSAYNECQMFLKMDLQQYSSAGYYLIVNW
jgi:hypothetical protein